MRRVIIYSLFLNIFATMVFSQTKVGTTAANFLTIPVGARASAMGGAFVALANDATCAFWNPAGLSQLEQSSVNITHANWFIDTNLNWSGVVIKLGDQAIGFSINQLDYGKEDITTEAQPNGTGQQWEAQDIAVGLSYARTLTDRFSFGATMKYIQSKIWHEEATAFAMDVGLLYKTEFRGMRIGMNISNFGTEMQMDGKDLMQPVDIDPGHSGNNENIVAYMDTDSWALPLYFTVGLGMDALSGEKWRLTLASDAIHPNNQKLHMNVGGEFVWNEFLALRGGYNSLFKEDAEEGLSLGFGIRYSISGFTILMDYSYLDFGVFSDISRYSLTFCF